MADQFIKVSMKIQKLPKWGDAHQLIDKVNELVDAVNLIYEEREFSNPMIVIKGEKKDGTS